MINVPTLKTLRDRRPRERRPVRTERRLPRTAAPADTSLGVVPFRGCKYRDAKTLANLVKGIDLWVILPHGLLQTSRQSAFLLMMFILAGEVERSRVFLRGKRADGKISRRAAF